MAFVTDVRGLAAIITGVLAIIVLLGNPRRPANHFLAVFLLLISANLALQILPPQGFLDASTLGRLAAVMAALDPAVFYLFMRSLTRRPSHDSPLWMVVVFGASVAFAAWALLAGSWQQGAPRGFQWALYAYTALVYGTVLAQSFRLVAGTLPQSPYRYLYLGLCLAVIPALPRPLQLLTEYFAAAAPASRDLYAVIYVYTSASTIILTAYLLSRPQGERTRGDSRFLRQGAWIGVMFFLILSGAAGRQFATFFFGVTASVETGRIIQTIGAVSGALRWALFSILVSIAALRHQLLEMNMRLRRVGARLLVALATGVAAFALFRIIDLGLGSIDVNISAFEIAFVLAALLFSQGFRRFLDWVALFVYRIPPAGDLPSTHRLYAAAAKQAMAEGRSPATDPFLLRLRNQLGLSPEVASSLSGVGVADAPLQVGETLLGRYKVLRRLGEGGSGQTFLAHDAYLHRDVAIKEVFDPEDPSADLLLKEARLCTKVKHPRVVTVFDAIPRSHGVLIIQEFLEGGSVSDYVRQQGPLTTSSAVRLVDDVLDGLEEIHRQQVVHRDLKPENILLDAQGRPKIADFGIAWTKGRTMQTFEARKVAGTPAFMAPEQLHGAPPSRAGDLFAVARLLQLLVKKPLPTGLARVVKRGLAPDPKDRFGTAAQMRQAIAKAARGKAESTARRR